MKPSRLCFVKTRFVFIYNKSISDLLEFDNLRQTVKNEWWILSALDTGDNNLELSWTVLFKQHTHLSLPKIAQRTHPSPKKLHNAHIQMAQHTHTYKKNCTTHIQRNARQTQKTHRHTHKKTIHTKNKTTKIQQKTTPPPPTKKNPSRIKLLN